MRIRLTLLALAAAVDAAGCVLPAQENGAARAVQLVAENDLFAVRGHGIPPDYDYTHGTRAGVTWSAAPARVARLLRAAASCRSPGARIAGCATSGVTFAQEIYTPRRDATLPIAGERPYAGWLALSATVRRVSPGTVRAAGLELGVTGRPSLAEQAQDDVHRIVASGAQLGWDHQLASRATVALRYAETRRYDHRAASDRLVAARLHWGAMAGNARTLLSAGADATVGMLGHAPWSPAVPDEPRPPRLFARLAVREDVVVRDAFVEGWRRGSGAARRPFVAEGALAVGARWRRYVVEYAGVLRGAEYRAEPSPHPYGSVRLTIDGY